MRTAAWIRIGWVVIVAGAAWAGVPAAGHAQEFDGGGISAAEREREASVAVLLARAETALATAVAAGEDPIRLRRARRLVHGARAAVTGHDLARALRRAQYACQLLSACAPAVAAPR